MAKVIVRDIWKRFGKEDALRGVSFECKEGEMVCLLGPSGAGKTTTINVISGIEKPDRGEIIIDDRPVTRLYPQERDVATAFESYALYPHLTVFENLAFPLKAPMRAAQFSKEDIERRVKEVAHMLNIGDLLERYPKQLSGGQRQRVALGRALVRKPKLYLLDEPIAHLDAKLRHRMRGELKKIQSELGITTIYCTPDQLEALSMADTIAVIHKGEILQIGDPSEVYCLPANTFVARFVGDPPMNIFDCRFEAGSLTVPANGSFDIPLLERHATLLAEKLGAEQLLKVGIRPKDIQLRSESVGDSHTRGEVASVETLGQTTIVSVAVGSTVIKVRVPTEEAPRRGQNVGLLLDVELLYYFDAATEVRIGP